jgi:pimeloyl-ACP methyl ester carboxylesterase
VVTTTKPEGGYDKKTMAQDVHALAASLGHQRVRLVGHDIGLMVAYAYAAQHSNEVDGIVLMDAFLPGVGDWMNVWLLRDLWHFHFYGATPLARSRPRAHLLRALLERFRRGSRSFRLGGGPPALCGGLCPVRRHESGLRGVPRLRAGRQGLHPLRRDEADDAHYEALAGPEIMGTRSRSARFRRLSWGTK